MNDPRDHAEDPHRWFVARLDAHATGLLDETEEERFTRHAATCETCRAALAAFAENLPDAPASDHLPLGLVTHWDRARTELEGIERELVGAHLSTCESCRRDLELLGFEPSLDHVRAPEHSEAVAAWRRAADRPAPLSVRLRQFLELVPHWVGAAAVAVIATVWLMHANAPTPNVRAVSPPPAPSGPLSLELAPAAGVVDLPAQVRGAGATEETTIHTRNGIRLLAFHLPAIYGSGSTSVALSISGPSPGDSARVSCRLAELRHGSALLLRSAGPRLTLGTYRLQARVGPDPEAQAPDTLSLEFGIRLVR